MQNCKNVAANLLLFDYLSDFAEKDSSSLDIQASSHDIGLKVRNHRAWSFQWARRLSCPYCYTKSRWKGESFEESFVLLWTWPNLTRKRIQKRCKRYFCKDPPVRLFAQSSNCARRLKIMVQKTGTAGLAGTTSIALVGKNGARRRGARMLMMKRKTRLEDILSDLLRTHKSRWRCGKTAGLIAQVEPQEDIPNETQATTASDSHDSATETAVSCLAYLSYLKLLFVFNFYLFHTSI